MDLRLLLMEDGWQDSEKIDNITINMVIYLYAYPAFYINHPLKE